MKPVPPSVDLEHGTVASSLLSTNADMLERRNGLVAQLPVILQLLETLRPTNPGYALEIAIHTRHELAHVFMLISDMPPDLLGNWNNSMRILGKPFDQLVIQ